MVFDEKMFDSVMISSEEEQSYTYKDWRCKAQTSKQTMPVKRIGYIFHHSDIFHLFIVGNANLALFTLYKSMIFIIIIYYVVCHVSQFEFKQFRVVLALAVVLVFNFFFLGQFSGHLFSPMNCVLGVRLKLCSGPENRNEFNA